MKYSIVLLWWSVFFCLHDSVLAQGVLFDTATYEQLPQLPLYEGIKGEGIADAVTFRPYCPTPQRQGQNGSCTGYAVGYGALSIQYALHSGQKDRKALNNEAFSATFLYNLAKADPKDCTKGAMLEKMFGILREKGDCLHREFSNDEDCTAQPSALAYTSALNYTVKDYATLFGVVAKPEEKVARIKRCLRDSFPVVVNIKLFRSFYNLRNTNFWKRPTGISDEYQGLHSLVIIGYNDYRQTFEVMNSWGTEWASGGFCEIGYEELSQICLAAYVIVPSFEVAPDFTKDNEAVATTSVRSPTTKETLPTFPQAAQRPQLTQKKTNESLFYLQGAFDFVQTIVTTDDQVLQQSQPVRYNPAKHCYETVRPRYPKGTLFQLTTTRIPAGKYVYVFSADPTGKVQLHFPKSLYVPQQPRTPVAQFLPAANMTITLPSAASALQINHTGSEWLCILYSEYQIADIADKLSQLTAYDDTNFYDRFTQLFGKQMIAPEAGRYAEDTMFAQATSSKSQGSLLPILLHVMVE